MKHTNKDVTRIYAVNHLSKLLSKLNVDITAFDWKDLYAWLIKYGDRADSETNKTDRSTYDKV